MAQAAVFTLSVLLTPAQGLQICTTLDQYKGVTEGVMLPDSQITNLTLPGIATCAKACLTRRICKSFNFNIDTGECQLNSKTTALVSTELESHDEFVFSDISHWPERLAGVCANHTCPFNSYCDPGNSSDVNHVCKVVYCLHTPSVEDGHVSTKPETSSLGTRLTLYCDPGYMAEGDVVCQDDGTWSSPVCASVSSCSMVKQYQPDSEDREYWLRFTNFDNYITKIYCHNMSTSSPQEFLTLPYINYGIFPRVMAFKCKKETKLRWACRDLGGEIWFNKIRVNIRTMKVIRKDRTFAKISHSGKYLDYGTALDCYTGHLNNKLRCGTKGRFNIDLRGTGWRVSEDQKWRTSGYKPIIEFINRQKNGIVIKIHCGGFWGGCVLSRGLFLKPFP